MKYFQALRNHVFLIKRVQRIQQLPRDLCQTLHPQIIKEAIDGKVGIICLYFSQAVLNGSETDSRLFESQIVNIAIA